MNASRQQSIIDGLRGQHRKCFDAVPIQEAWTIQQIFGEIQRAGGSMSFGNIERCLGEMTEQGILVSTGSGSSRLFQKAKIRKPGHAFTMHDEHAITTKGTLHMPRTSTETMPPTDPINDLAEVASKLRADAATLLERAEAIDKLAIAASDAIKAAGEGSETLATLRKLLATGN